MIEDKSVYCTSNICDTVFDLIGAPGRVRKFVLYH